MEFARVFSRTRPPIRECRPDRIGKERSPGSRGFEERMMGLEPTTFCMAKKWRE
jgi:hypothetical protein